MSVIKKRSGGHEDTIREYRIGKSGLDIGDPLEGFQGVLRGVPTYTGSGQPLLNTGGDLRLAPDSGDQRV
jgi:circadian clock protein KaiC